MIPLKKLFLFFACLCCLSLQAQELQVTSFIKQPTDLLARVSKRADLNGNPCAIVRVSVPNSEDYQFEGNIIGDVVYKAGEALVYMTEGSRYVTIKSSKFGSMRYNFTETLEKETVYKLTLKFIQSEANKTRTLVMPVAGIGANPSFGIMLGIVKKFGGYIKAKYDFKTLASDGTCDSNGLVDGQQAWFSDEGPDGVKGGRLAVTGGALVRLSLPCYLYTGVGYGYNKLLWETHDGKWLENSEKTSSGIEAELGIILRAKNVAFSAGVQSNSFKNVEANVGIGFMF